MSTAAIPSLPLTIGTPEQFRQLRTTLQSAGFTEEGICGRLDIRNIFEFAPLRDGRVEQTEAQDALGAFIWLLMDGEVMDQRIAGLLPPGTHECLDALGVITRMPGDEPRWFSTVLLYPVAGLYTCSDRAFLPQGIEVPLPDDVVYAAITKNTSRFLSILPDEPCDAFLDLCAGSGIGAMVAARYSKHAWAADLGRRSVHYSDFNRRLNGQENVTAVQGDLYEAVAGLTFDRISAHPPYVPKQVRQLLFRDGGDDGEQILARIVEGLPKHLRPGGRFYCQTMGTDRKDESLEQRVRRWLGDRESEFDVILVATEAGKKPEAVIKAVTRAKGRLGELSATTQLYEKLGVTGAFYGAIVVQRKTAARPPVTARTLKAVTAGGDAIEWFRRWSLATVEPGFAEYLLGARPRQAATMSLHVTHKPQDGQLLPSRFDLRASYPFASQAAIEPWVAVLVGACDGSRSGRELLAWLKQQDAVTATMTDQEFADILALLSSSGFLELERFPLPIQSE